jgi:hypothetical protein
MILSMIALTMAAAPCTLPPALSGWTRTGPGLDTRHAVTLKPRQGRVETQVRIRKAGTFGIAIDREGWVDLATAGGKPLRMVSESRGPRCSSIRKIVRYRLEPGSYRVTVERLRGERAKLMLVRGEFARTRRRG